jgi:hypothetical protein
MLEPAARSGGMCRAATLIIMAIRQLEGHDKRSIVAPGQRPAGDHTSSLKATGSGLGSMTDQIVIEAGQGGVAYVSIARGRRR